ncbi:MAG: UDP-N-acetylmuramate dehydrogenase [Flavobacteriales bacterium]|nr:UDP-N-acetylmuramate dehydrogenase [Flavobacteriales bacterium]
MDFQQNISLKAYNTFGLEVRAEQFASFSNEEELVEGLDLCHAEPSLILGGGSNILLTKDIPGLVLRNEIPGIDISPWNDETYIVRAGAGMVWHDLVSYCVENGLGGIENLSLIPGSVGAAPMQNIGAYGVEIKDVFHGLEALHIPTGEVHRFGLEECRFGYRESVFKRSLKGQYVITRLELRLSKNSTLNTSYGAIEAELERLGKAPSIQSISEAVINIRRSKLPDPQKIGNAGSFFKNPVIESERFEEIRSRYPDIPNYPAPQGVKVAAGWLIEQAGWKGKDLGGYGVHDRQALVLVNRGQATGEKLYRLSKDIIASVHEKYGITLEREVNVI